MMVDSPASGNSSCPRCKQIFICNAGDIENCQCSEVKLNDAQRVYVTGLFEGCLCAKCMKELAAEYNQVHSLQD